MNARPRFKKVLTAVLILVVISSVALAATTLQTYEDGPAYTTDWNQSTYSGELTQSNYNSSSSDISLEFHDVSGSEGGFGDWVDGDSAVAGTSSELRLKDGDSAGQDRGFWAGQPDSNELKGSAYWNGETWFLGSSLWTVSQDSGYSQKCDGVGGSGENRALADGGSYGDLVVATSVPLSSQTQFYSINTDTCSSTFFDDSGGDFGPNVRGLAKHENDNSKFYVITGGSNNLITYNPETDTKNQVIDLPDGSQRELDVKTWPDGTVWFIVAYDGGNGQDELQIIEKSTGNTVRSFTSDTGAIEAPVWNPESDQKKVYYVNNVDEQLHEKTIVDLWEGDGEASVKYQHTLGDVPENDLKDITWEGEAPSTFKGTGGQLALQAKNKNGNWETLDIQDSGTGVFSNTVSLGSNFHGVSELTYRVVVQNNYKIRGNSLNPKVIDVSWSYDYYSSSGTVTSLPIDTSRVEEFENLTVQGASGGSGVTARVLDKDGKVEYEQSIQPNSTLNLSSVPVDYSTKEVKVQFELESNGLSSPELSGYKTQWLKSPITPPKITDHYAEVGTTKTTETEGLETGVGSTDTFVIENVDKTVDDVRWFVNGELASSSNVSGTGPYSFNTTWEESGVNSVTGVVENNSSGLLDYVEWEVQVYEIAIQGEDSYTGSYITTTQTFTVFGTEQPTINYSIEYNESIVTKVSGPENGTVSNGESRTWEFQVKEDEYSGSPITVVATYKNKTSEKSIHVSTAPGGIIGGGDGNNLDVEFISNYWSQHLFGDQTSSTYLLAQGILATGFGLLIWLHHFGLVYLPKLVSRRLGDRITKGFVTVIGGSLILGVNLMIWSVMSGALGFAYFRYVNTGRTPIDDIKQFWTVVKGI